MNSQKPELLPCPFCGEQVDPPKSRPSSRDKSEGFVAFLACYCGGYSANAHRMGQGETEKDAIQDVIAKWNTRAVPPSAVVPEGYVLVPARIELSPTDIAAIMFQCGGADDEADSFEDQFNGGILWFGTVHDDEGNTTYGMHIACAECLEEGSTTLAEFAAPRAAAQPVTAELLEVIGYASPGQIEILRTLPRTGGMKVKGCKDNRYTEPVVLLSAARSALFAAVIRCEQAGAFKTCMECGYQDGHDPICNFHEGKRQPNPDVARLREALEGVWKRCRGSGYVGQDGQYLKVVRATLDQVSGRNEGGSDV